MCASYLLASHLQQQAIFQRVPCLTESRFQKRKVLCKVLNVFANWFLDFQNNLSPTSLSKNFQVSIWLFLIPPWHFPLLCCVWVDCRQKRKLCCNMNMHWDKCFCCPCQSSTSIWRQVWQTNHQPTRGDIIWGIHWWRSSCRAYEAGQVRTYPNPVQSE